MGSFSHVIRRRLDYIITNKKKGRGKQGRGDMGTEETAEMLWQAKLATGDYHAAMTGSIYMEWLERRLSPAFKSRFRRQGNDSCPRQRGLPPWVRL